MNKSKNGSCIAIAIGLFLIFMVYTSFMDNLAANPMANLAETASHPMNYAVLFILISIVIFYDNACVNACINENRLIVLCIFIIGQCLAFYYSNNYLYANTRYALVFAFLFQFLLFISLPYNTYFSKTTVSYLINSIIGIGLFCCFYQFIVSKGINFFLNPNYNFQAFFNSRNTFGHLLALCIMLCFYQLHKNKHKIIYIIIFILLFINLLATLSRDSYLMVAVMFFTYYFVANHHKTFVLFITTIIVVCSIFIIQQNHTIQDFIFNYMIRYDAGLNGRNDLWNLAFTKIDIPTILFGQGLGSPLFILHYNYFTYQHSFHSNYIDMLYSGGLVYYIIYIYTIAITIKKIILLWTIDKTSARFFIASMTAILVYGCFEVYLPFYFDQSCVIETVVLFTLPIMVANSNDKQLSEQYDGAQELSLGQQRTKQEGSRSGKIKV